MKMRVVIADDEPLSRERLRQLLEAEAHVEIVAECGTGPETVNAIQQTSPDLIFLDVKMPELDGFGVLSKLKGVSVPVVVFVTAHDQFAARAFDVQAVDYLVKPFDRQRFRTAFARARERVQHGQVVEKTHQLVSSLAQPSKEVQRIVVRSAGRISFVQIDEINWICAADNYAELHLDKTSHFLRTTMAALMEQLPRGRFLRISRSQIINVERIKEIRPKCHGDYYVFLKDGTKLTASRNYRTRLIDLVKNRC
jgi:two-component system LytT family response regulator